MRKVTDIHLEGGNQHQHIAKLRWVDDQTSIGYESTRAEMVQYLLGGGRAYVVSGTLTTYLKVVHAIPPYVQTYADNTPTDNLLRLPHF